MDHTAQHCENTPREEFALRYQRCRELLQAMHPEAGGLMLFGRVNIYYFSGIMGSGVFWLPREGPPLLMVRKGLGRAQLDNPHLHVARYRSYGDLQRLAEEYEVPLTPVIAAEQSSLSWALAENLKRRLSHLSFVNAEALLGKLRAIKSPWELIRMRAAGSRHAEAMEALLPGRIKPGMTELRIAHHISDIFFSLGSSGLTRMNAFGEEMFLGTVSAGENGNFPTFYNGPLGCKGAHPSCPFLGSPDTVWKAGEILSLDAGFCFEGYNSDKTICYFAGRETDIPSLVRRAHETCREIEAAVAERMRPGALPLDLYALGLSMAEQAGFSEGFMGIGGNKVPFLGHGIGLCIDEWPVLAARFDNPLSAGMTLAVEPKIGLPGIGMVGTENTWEITGSGARPLSGVSGPLMGIV